MVYSVTCDECGEVIDFGGREPSEFSGHERLPEDAIEFDDRVYCRDCVKEFVEFGTGDIIQQIEDMKDDMDEIKDRIGFEEED
ncbi:MAG: hypothetical protein ABEK01_04270 [Candidatus Nanohaloarchaea archaeon]